MDCDEAIHSILATAQRPRDDGSERTLAAEISALTCGQEPTVRSGAGNAGAR